MFSKTKSAQLAAVAALALMLGAGATVNSAQAQGNQPQNDQKIEKKSDSGARTGGDQRRDAGSSKEMKREGNSSREMRSDRSRETTSSRTTVRNDRDRDHNRTRVSVRERDHDHDRWRGHGRESYAATFVVLGERRHYRPGWCRGLHRGHHWAPNQGEHAGKHVGLFRC